MEKRWWVTVDDPQNEEEVLGPFPERELAIQAVRNWVHEAFAEDPFAKKLDPSVPVIPDEQLRSGVIDVDDSSYGTIKIRIVDQEPEEEEEEETEDE